MSLFSSLKAIDKKYLSLFEKLQDKTVETENSSNRFNRYPNGYLVHESADHNQFFKNRIKEPNKKDTLSKFISTNEFLTKLATTTFDIQIPNSIVTDEQITAIKLINDSIILWTDSSVYKIPTSDKAKERIIQTQKNLEPLNGYSNEIKSFFLIPEFIEHKDFFIQKSLLCETVDLSKQSIQHLDQFLTAYFTEVFSTAEKHDSLYRGLTHGDLHFRNIFQTEEKLLITDLDLLSQNGFPFIDLMHFTVHLVRNIEKTSQYQPLKNLLEDKTYLYSKLLTYKFSNLSDLWLRYYHEDYIPLYMQSQLIWYYNNKVVSDELDELKQIEKMLVL